MRWGKIQGMLSQAGGINESRSRIFGMINLANPSSSHKFVYFLHSNEFFTSLKTRNKFVCAKSSFFYFSSESSSNES
jgi:hypothetical protein